MAVTAFLCGDVMTGRGVDQILPHPGDPRLWESYVRDAREYVKLAEAANGPINAPVDFAWPWGDALEVLAAQRPDVRVINLETSITRGGEPAPGKAVHYRMSPENIGCLTVARPDVCALANNHTLDFGRRGLADTLAALAAAGLSASGAGADIAEASRGVIVRTTDGGRVVVKSVGMRSSGIPDGWAATSTRSGVALLKDERGAADRLCEDKRPGDTLIVSVHWGSNWGYDVPDADVDLAHRMVDAGADIVHGHSAHHVRPVEVYRDRLILYGCGDFVDDYEGISGHEQFRPDLRVAYLVTVETGTGRLLRLRMAPLQARQMSLHHATAADTEQLRRVLDWISAGFGARFRTTDDGMLELLR